MPETLDIETLFAAGAHFGYARTRRHPSASAFIFGTKDHTDIFDLLQTKERLQAARAFAADVGKKGGQILFVSGKNESQAIVKQVALRAGSPYCAGRWIGGTLTNFKSIRKRLALLDKLTAERESGELDKYTKRERLLIDRQIGELETRFGGITALHDLPAAVFVVDTHHENTAVAEANQLHIPVIGLSSSDCDFSLNQYPIPANDTSVRSVKLIVEAIADAYQEGKKVQAASPKSQTSSST